MTLSCTTPVKSVNKVYGACPGGSDIYSGLWEGRYGNPVTALLSRQANIASAKEVAEGDSAFRGLWPPLLLSSLNT